MPTSHEELHTQQGVSRRDESLPGLRMNSTTGAGLAGRGRAQLYGPNGVSLYKHTPSLVRLPQKPSPQTSCSPAMTPVATI